MPINILLVIDGHIRRAGVQILFLNLCRRLSPDKYRFIWYFTGDLIDQGYYNEISQISYAVFWRKYRHKNRLINYIRMLNDLRHLINNNHMDILHMNSGLHFTNGLFLLYARLRRIRKRISHIHGCNPKLATMKGPLHNIIVSFLRFFILSNANTFISCSQEAAGSVFGSQMQNYSLLTNGIDPETYFYSVSLRAEIRNQLKLEENFVVGTVSRFSPIKNHRFLIECFWELHKKEKNSKLLLVGDGELKDAIENYVEQLGIEESVIFVGPTEHVNLYLQAMDAFVLPSFSEGLGLVNIEAQTAGLPCIVSTGIPKEVKITSHLEHYPLSDGPEKWADYILSYKNNYIRKNNQKELENSEYNINKSVIQLDAIYQGEKTLT